VVLVGLVGLVVLAAVEEKAIKPMEGWIRQRNVWRQIKTIKI
jgi:hypothetical protein